VATRRFTAPDGVTWSIRRRWIPHREGTGVRARFRKHRRPRHERPSRFRNGADVIDIGVDIEAFVIAVGVVIFLITMLLFGWPIVLLGIDAIWLLRIGTLGLLGRVVLRRPWRVEAVSDDERRQWHVQGFRNAGNEHDELARRSQLGQNPRGVETSQVPH
jgi:hypothetical protein